MKTTGLLLITLGGFVLNANAKSPIEITCGDLQKGVGIVFEISPLSQTAKYTTYLDGEPSALGITGPSAGLYSSSSLSFTSSGDFSSHIHIHGSYKQVLRINHFSAFTLDLEKDWGTQTYSLKGFSAGSVTTSSFADVVVNEKPYPQFTGLECTVAGI